MAKVVVVLLAMAPLLVPRGVCVCHWTTPAPHAADVAHAAEACCDGHHDETNDGEPAGCPTPHHDCEICERLSDLPYAAPQAAALPLDVSATWFRAPIVIAQTGRSVVSERMASKPASAIPLYLSCCALLI